MYAGGVESTSLHERLKTAIGDRSLRHLAEVTGASPESIRRYLAGGPPSGDFLTRLCARLDLNGEWLLTGRGPMRASEVKSHALREAAAPELLTAVAGTLERLIDRVERMEAFLSTLEVRLRARHADNAGGDFHESQRPALPVLGRAKAVAEAVRASESG